MKLTYSGIITRHAVSVLRCTSPVTVQARGTVNPVLPRGTMEL